MQKIYQLYHFLILVFLSASTTVIAQELKVSDPIDLGNGVSYELIQRFENQTLLYRATETKYYVHCFDAQLKERWVKLIEFDEKDVMPLKIVPHKDRFYLVYSFFKRNKTHIKAKVFDKDAMVLNELVIGQFDFVDELTADVVIVSKDKQQLLIAEPGYDGFLHSINYDLEHQSQRWHQKFGFKNLNLSRDFQQVLINSKGEVFIVYNQDNTPRKRKTHQFVVYKISPNRALMTQKIPFHDFISYDMEAQYDEVNDKLVIAGLYSNNNYLANGIFYFNTDLAAVPNIEQSEFEESFMRSLTGKRKKRLIGIQNFTICQMILRKDGGVLLAAEQRFAYESSNAFYEEERGRAHSDYLFENILVASVHPSGKVYWKDVLFKSQSSENDQGRYSSFFAMKTSSNLRFVYNDNISWGTSIFEYVIHSSGTVERNVVAHQERKNSVLPQLTNSLQVSSSEVLALSERNKKLRVLKIAYK